MLGHTPEQLTAFAELAVKHLPPSASRLRLVDVGGRLAAALAQRREDLDIATPVDLASSVEPGSADGIVALDHPRALDADFLAAAERLLRPGGRITMIDTEGKADKTVVRMLEGAGFTRILVEPIEGGGVLMRGEVSHTTNSTFARVRVAADADADNLSFVDFDGPYVFLLVQQSPNKPVWKLTDGETLRWDALVSVEGDARTWVALTSLPKAVGLMQRAVMEGIVRDVNKIGKFSRATVAAWGGSVLLNPTLDVLKERDLTTTPVDPATAEAPDE